MAKSMPQRCRQTGCSGWERYVTDGHGRVSVVCDDCATRARDGGAWERSLAAVARRLGLPLTSTLPPRRVIVAPPIPKRQRERPAPGVYADMRRREYRSERSLTAQILDVLLEAAEPLNATAIIAAVHRTHPHADPRSIGQLVCYLRSQGVLRSERDPSRPNRNARRYALVSALPQPSGDSGAFPTPAQEHAA